MSSTFRTFLTLILMLTAASALDAPEDQSATPKTLESKLPVMISSVTSQTEPPPTTTTTREEEAQHSLPMSSTKENVNVDWECPNITGISIECSCDFPHTLRCTGDRTALQAISKQLKKSPSGSISLLDITVTGITTLPENFFDNIALHGLVISTGELRRVHSNAFAVFARPLQALGLPNNLLDSIPTAALAHLWGLDRLDLSHNKLVTLEADSFQNLTNLTYLDLSENMLSQLSPQAFASLPGLRLLKMRSNHLSASALSALRGLENLEELDLSNNMLIGPVSPSLLPPMGRLRFLTLAENELKNVQEGALSGLKNLTDIILSHNQIDVLEDHAFKFLSSLRRLDLANNRIVAVSSSSLAHLEKLTTLDLTHNFLRSLTADLAVPLMSLQDLRLDDNDITMVASDVPVSKLLLTRLSLSDNPLNCDCTLLEFANWLSNSSLNEEDKLSAVCATPPALENGILTQVSPGSLLCGEPTSTMSKVPLTGTQLTLQEFHYSEASGVNLLWNVESCTERYTCDTLIVYETIGDNEVRTDSSPLHCDSRLMRNPCSLAVAIPSSLHLQLGHKYRYCVVLLVPTAYDDVYLDVGCSDIIALEETISRKIEEETKEENKINGVFVNISKDGLMQVNAEFLQTKSEKCEFSVVVHAGESSSVRRKKSSCNASLVTFEGLAPGHYRVCASLDEAMNSADRDRSRCVEVQTFKQNSEVFVLAIVATVCTVLVMIFLIVRSLVKKARLPRTQGQCFLPAQEFEITHKAHYIKLMATNKV